MTEKKKRGGYGPRPHTWISGADEYKHSMYVPWMKAHAQANFRGEEWTLTFEEWFKLWDGRWEKRGRGSDDLCMTREDFEGVWSADNIIILTRSDHLARQAEYKYGPKPTTPKKYYKPTGKPRGRVPKDRSEEKPKRKYTKATVVFKKMKVSK
jgi:hypothetical protein